MQVLLKQFGYRKGELEGKNVSLLMPQPFSGQHNGYLRNYQTTGKAKILDSVQPVGEVQHHAALQKCTAGIACCADFSYLHAPGPAFCMSHNEQPAVLAKLTLTCLIHSTLRLLPAHLGI